MLPPSPLARALVLAHPIPTLIHRPFKVRVLHASSTQWTASEFTHRPFKVGVLHASSTQWTASELTALTLFSQTPLGVSGAGALSSPPPATAARPAAPPVEPGLPGARRARARLGPAGAAAVLRTASLDKEAQRRGTRGPLGACPRQGPQGASVLHASKSSASLGGWVGSHLLEAAGAVSRERMPYDMSYSPRSQTVPLWLKRFASGPSRRLHLFARPPIPLRPGHPLAVPRITNQVGCGYFQHSVCFTQTPPRECRRRARQQPSAGHGPARPARRARAPGAGFPRGRAALSQPYEKAAARPAGPARGVRPLGPLRRQRTTTLVLISASLGRREGRHLPEAGGVVSR